MKPNRRTILAACLICLATSSMAQERASKDEAKALCDIATAHVKKVGLDQAKRDFAADKAKWMPKDLYPFVIDLNGIMRFHISEKMIDKNVIDMKDASGKPFGVEMVQVAKSPKANGWVDYEWVHPTSKKIEDKTSFIQRVPGAELLVGVGVYR